MDWKKEIKVSDLLRRPEQATSQGAASEGGGEGSIWKREIKLSSLFRRRKGQAQRREPLALPLPGDTVPEAPSARISDPHAEQPASGAVARDASDEPVAGEPELEAPVADETVDDRPPVEPYSEAAEAEEAPVSEPEASVDEWAGEEDDAPEARGSFWKKDVSFGRKAKKAAPAVAAAAAVTVSGGDESAPAAKQSFWKRDLGGRGKAKPAGDSGPERRDEQPDGRDAPPRGGPERAPRHGTKLPDVPLMKAMNLLPKDAQRAATTLRPGVLQAAAIGAAVLLLGGVGLLYATGKQRVAEKEEILADRTAELTSLEAQLLPAESDDTTLAGESLSRATALSGALEGRMNWDRLLRELSLTLPENVWFESFLTTSPTITTPVPAEGTTTPPVPVSGLPAGTTLTINGYATSQEDVGYLLSRLTVIPEFSSVQLAQSGRTEIGENQVFKFTVVGTFKRPGQASQADQPAQQQQASQSGQVTP